MRSPVSIEMLPLMTQDQDGSAETSVTGCDPAIGWPLVK
jgi:hypothetical protein